jgi:hypothetical protein
MVMPTNIKLLLWRYVEGYLISVPPDAGISFSIVGQGNQWKFNWENGPGHRMYPKDWSRPSDAGIVCLAGN